ncbi:MAG: NAD-dependent epimerase/dehydratase family protein [Bryobacteraceae bacterium]
MSSVITGGAGFVGSHLAERLAEAGEDVSVVDNLVRGSWGNLASAGNSIRKLQGDIRELADLKEAFEGAEVVYHLAALSRVMDCELNAEDCSSVNVIGTHAVLRAAVECGVSRVVFASSREVYGEPETLPVHETANLRPRNLYGASKLAGEVYCRMFADAGLEVSMLRLSNAYGLRDRDRVIPRFFLNAANGSPLTIYGGEQILDFVWVDDVTNAFMIAGTGSYKSEPINVGSGIGTTLTDLASRVLSMTGSRSQLIHSKARTVEVVNFIADTGRCRSELGLAPVTDPLHHLPSLYLEKTKIRAGFEMRDNRHYGTLL